MLPYLSEHWFGQIGSLEERNGFNATYPLILIQICLLKVLVEEGHVDRRHLSSYSKNG